MLDPLDLRITSYGVQSGYGAGGMQLGMNPAGITVMHIPSGIGITCDSERSQHANKEKALRMLESLVGYNFQQAVDSLWEHAPHLVPTPVANNIGMGPHGIGKVNMIKVVREALGCGLKEAKELVDKHYQHADCKELCIKEHRGGYCIMGDACVCGNDLAFQTVCFNWNEV